MGNKIARTTQASATEYYLHDLPSSYNLVLKEVLGRGRFLKSIQCKHDEGLVLVKVYFKRGDSIDLREYERRLSQLREIFRRLDHPHCWPFQFWLETDKAAYLLRQYFFNNLHDRLSTRPFLSIVEKKWLAFQLLYAVKQSHEHGVCHGDIKCENVLVTSWNWLYLADFASFKPTYIPHDDPSDFSFFFDTGGRRRCYLAPERFYEHGGEMQVSQDAPLKPSMDIFAVGCVIAELFLEGQPLFELSQLLAYRRGQYDPTQHLEKIPDSGIRKMILHMIQLDPELRFSAENYLQSYASVVFPSYFSPFLHGFYSCLNPLDSDTRVVMCQTVFQEIHKQMMSNRSNNGVGLGTGSNTIGGQSSLQMDTKQIVNLKNDSERKKEEVEKGSVNDRLELLGDISNLLRDVKQSNRCSGVKPMLEDVASSAYSQNKKHGGMQSPGELLQTISNVFNRNHYPFLKKITMNELNTLMSEYDNQSDTFGMPSLPLPQDTVSCEGMVLISSLLCSCIRNVKLPHLRRGTVLLLKSCSLYTDDEDRLQRVLPYVVAMLSDPASIVRCAALETLCDILPLVRDFPPSDAKIFPEYIFPMLSMLPDDPEESVRICYASNISKLALTAYGFLIHSISLSEAGVLIESNSSQRSPFTDTSGRLQNQNSDVQLARLRKAIAEVIQELVMGPKQTPNIRRALLQDIGNLCWFFGQRQSNDLLLPILPAFLNDRDEQLRTVFYGHIIYVCFFVGQRSVEEYLLPYIEQALSDASEAVIANALDCLAILCKSSFLRKRVLLQMIERAFPLLCYPSQWVRRSAVTFIAASSENLGAVDSYVFLVPVIRPFLRRQPASIASEKSLLACLKPPIARQVFYEVLESARSSDMLERQRKIWYNSSAQPKQWETIDSYKRAAAELNPMKGWSDRQYEVQGHNPVGNGMEPLDPTICADGDTQMSATSSFLPNASGAVGSHDSLCSEKLQFSSFMSPQVSGLNSFICDKSSEGIPLYYFKKDKQAVPIAPAASDSALRLNTLGFGSSSMPWMDPANKSLGLASSFPTPTLVSGSFSISNNSKQFHRVVHEAEGRESDQTTYINSKFPEVSISSTMKGSAISAEDATTPNDVSGLPSFTRGSSIPDSGWRPRGVLVAHLQEHRSAVNDIAISTDHSFFVSASDDSTVKVWDSRKLEKDISFRSRLTYSLDGNRALCVTMLQGSAQVVVGSCDGMIHMFSVDYISRGLGNVVEKYTGVGDVKKRSVGEGAILSLLNYSDSDFRQMVMYSTQNCGIHLWDTRTNSNAWNEKVSPEEGYVSSLVASPCGNWFVSGSSRGLLTLWDLRFCLPVNSWQYSLECPIEKMCLFLPPSNTAISTVARPLVYVAAGCNEVSLWNAENGSCHQVLKMVRNDSDTDFSDLPWALTRPSSKANIKPDLRRNVNPKYRVDEVNEPSSRLPGIRSLLPLPGGDLLTGGTDLKIRRWDHYSPDRSYSVCGPSIKGVGNDDFYETKSSFGVQVVQETKRRPLATKLTSKAVLAAAATDSAGCHRDSIRSLASVKVNQRLLISSCRDGAIKVWK
ncbi:Serine/threonine-protein kinase vps15 [Actinidia chinensis var. chinensis]|uniref:non-specific serine/threonine protein kinase n=1 Tax=Actinidia chinensis var. chinensis TaxID=1590841 RepID=A0A2R6Q4X6_ACTCC|nr:Serine/threonine-protein kinase vps15 [Actinidia chinensis var. chinensis]